MNKNQKREMKKQRKLIFIFLAVCLPIMVVLAYVLYRFAPSLVNQQWIVVALIVIFGLVLWFAYQWLLKKQAEKNAQKPTGSFPTVFMRQCLANQCLSRQAPLTSEAWQQCFWHCCRAFFRMTVIFCYQYSTKIRYLQKRDPKSIHPRRRGR